MYVKLGVYIHSFMHTYIHIHIYIHTFTCRLLSGGMDRMVWLWDIATGLRVRIILIQLCMHVCVCISFLSCTCMYVCMYVCMCWYRCVAFPVTRIRSFVLASFLMVAFSSSYPLHIYTYICIHIHTYIHTYIHTVHLVVYVYMPPTQTIFVNSSYIHGYILCIHMHIHTYTYYIHIIHIYAFTCIHT